MQECEIFFIVSISNAHTCGGVHTDRIAFTSDTGCDAQNDSKSFRINFGLVEN